MGHQRVCVPEIGDYYALPHENEGRALVRNGQGQVELISNVCRHRQAGRCSRAGATCKPKARASAGGDIVCPLHRWTYSPSGELLGAPHFPPRPLPAPEQLQAARVERPAV